MNIPLGRGRTDNKKLMIKQRMTSDGKTTHFFTNLQSTTKKTMFDYVADREKQITKTANSFGMGCFTYFTLTVLQFFHMQSLYDVSLRSLRSHNYHRYMPSEFNIEDGSKPTVSTNSPRAQAIYQVLRTFFDREFTRMFLKMVKNDKGEPIGNSILSLKYDPEATLPPTVSQFLYRQKFGRKAMHENMYKMKHSDFSELVQEIRHPDTKMIQTKDGDFKNNYKQGVVEHRLPIRLCVEHASDSNEQAKRIEFRDTFVKLANANTINLEKKIASYTRINKKRTRDMMQDAF